MAWRRRGADGAAREAAQGAGGAGAGAAAGGGGGAMPTQVAEMFREAQSSILELNQSRVAALEELQLARLRITELGTRAPAPPHPRPVPPCSPPLPPRTPT